MSQSQEQFVVAINGPPGEGKSWLSDHLLILFGSRLAVKLSFAEPLYREVYRLLDVRADMPKAVFKESRYGEMTGREWLIKIGNERREEDIHYWSRRLTSNPFFSQSSISIIDDLGFESEQEWLKAKDSHQLITVVIAPTHYTIGMQYEGDSRFCLPPIGGFRTTDSTRAFNIFKQWLYDATPDDTGIVAHPSSGSHNLAKFMARQKYAESS